MHKNMESHLIFSWPLKRLHELESGLPVLHDLAAAVIVRESALRSGVQGR